MKRAIENQLIAWKLSPDRKPLILNGARQVGKTYILKEFATRQYKRMAYVNLDNNPEAVYIFEKDYQIDRIVRSLSALLNVHIEPGNTLIILDEVQECPKALSSLKYFMENAPEYHIVVAGSLLGISLHGGASFPVGKVDMIKMYPMTFSEFLVAIDEEMLEESLSRRDFDIIDSLASRYKECLRQYYFTGGMPAAVKEYVLTQNLQKVRQIQKQILFDYRRDFSKHAPAEQVPRINMVWDSIPAQLAKDNKKFIYGAMKKGARATEFELAIQWLMDAGLVYRIHRVSAPGMPLKFYEDTAAFKLFSLDVGLMGAMTDTPAASLLIGNKAFVEFKGAFTELYVLTQLLPMDLPIFYYSTNDSRAELDFVVQYDTRVVPVEVKAEVSVQSKSLRTFVEKHPSLQGLRLSMLPSEHQDWMDNRPLYAPACWFA